MIHVHIHEAPPPGSPEVCRVSIKITESFETEVIEIKQKNLEISQNSAWHMKSVIKTGLSNIPDHFIVEWYALFWDYFLMLIKLKITNTADVKILYLIFMIVTF